MQQSKGELDAKPVKHPERAWVEGIISAADKANIPVFVKEPLAFHMGIQRKEIPGIQRS